MVTIISEREQPEMVAGPNRRSTPRGSSNDDGATDRPVRPSRDRVTVAPFPTTANHCSSGDLRHLAKTLAVTIGLTALFMTPQFLIHIPTGIIAPISAGYMTGGLMRVTGKEAVIIGFTLFLVVGLPVPLAYQLFGVLNHLPFVAIAVLSGVFATYYGCLIGIMSWIGGGGLQRS
jgi:hypothetical protein